MKLSEFPTKSIGIGNVSVTFSTAKIGSPAVIFPIIGTSTNSFFFYLSLLDVLFSSPEPPFNKRKVLPFLSCFLMYPFSSSFAKYP